MANITSIGKAKAQGLLLKRLFGVEPNYEYGSDHVRVYWQPDKLKIVQMKIAKMQTVQPGDVRIDWFPAVSPLVIKKALPYALGAVVLGYVLGKM